MFLFLVLFFFCKQKTAYDMRISDWSSDVCSSDLPCEPHRLALMLGRIPAAGERQRDREARARKAEDDAQRERPGEAAHARKPRDEQTRDDDDLADRARAFRPDAIADQHVDHAQHRAAPRPPRAPTPLFR